MSDSKEVKRWAYLNSEDAKIHDEGNWVKFEDVQTLKQERDDYRAVLNKLIIDVPLVSQIRMINEVLAKHAGGTNGQG